MSRSIREVRGNEPEDTELLAQLGAGDARALEALYDRHSGLVHALALRLLGRSEEAEEITQDVFWRLWTSPADYDPGRGSLRTWLFVVTRSRCLDRIRQTRRQAAVASPDATDPVVHEATPEEGASLAQRRRHVKEALGSLPAEQRHAVELCFLNGLSHSEAAIRLGEPLGTVKSRVRMGIAKLKASLEGLRGAS